MRDISDLEACYDRKLHNIGGAVDKSIGTRREARKLTAKVLPWCQHFIGATHVASKDSHGGMNELIGGVGQGSVFS